MGVMTVTRRDILGKGALGLGAATIAATAAANGAAQSAAPSSALLMASDFGVTAGAEDQSVALQAAMNAAIGDQSMLVLPGGGIRAGGLVITGTLHMTGVAGSTVIESTGGEGPVLSASNISDVTVSNITVSGALAPPKIAGDQGLVQFTGAGNLALHSCRILGSPANGLVLQGCSGVVSDCEIADVAQTALFSNDAKGMLIARCHIHDCANNGIQVWQSEKREDGSIITQNRVERIASRDGGSGQNGNGINVFRANGVVVSDNRITDCEFTAIRFNASDNAQITGNSCARLNETAVYVEFGFDGAVVANNQIDTAANGISITNFNDGGRLAVCSGNLVRNMTARPGEMGIGIGAEADTAVTGNVVENAPAIGIALGWGRYTRDLSASSNVIRDCGIGIGASVSSDAGPVLIAGNTISGSKDHAIAGLRHDKVVLANLDASKISTRQNLTLSGNVITS